MGKKEPANRKKAVAKQAPAKKTPAKRTPAKSTKPTRADRLKQALDGRKGSAILLGKSADDIWGRPSYYVDTRSIALNKALGVPGWPAGRIIEIYGPESSGKSTLADSALAECQEQGGLAILIDTEHVRDFAYMKALGIDVDTLVIEQVETIEEVFGALVYWTIAGREIVGPDKPVVIVWDSVAGTPTDEERKKGLKDMGEKTRASAAKAIKQGLRVVAQNVARTQTVVICTNQCYSSMSQFGGKKTYGGDGLPYHASIRVDLFPWLSKDKRLYHRGVDPARDAFATPAGVTVGVRIAKNKVGPPLRECTIGIIYGHGIDNGYSMWRDFIAHGGDDPAVFQNSSWYGVSPRLGEFEGATKWQGGGHWGLNELIAMQPDDRLWKKLLEEYERLP